MNVQLINSNSKEFLGKLSTIHATKYLSLIFVEMKQKKKWSFVLKIGELGSEFWFFFILVNRALFLTKLLGINSLVSKMDWPKVRQVFYNLP